MSRWVIGPEDRTFTVFGRARLSADLAEERIDAFLGIPSAEEGGVTATSSARLPGDLASRASAAVDGDTTTAYRTPFNGIAGTTLEFTYPEPVSVDDLQLQVVADGRHSLPTLVSLSVDGGPSQQYELEPLPLGEGEPRGTVATLTVPTGVLTGTTFRLSIDAVTEAESEDWFGRSRIVLPLAIAEVGLPTVSVPSSARLDDRCRDDLITLDGEPVPVAVRGTVGAAAAGDSVELVGCGDAADGVEIAAGRQLLVTAPGDEVDLDVDLLALSSAPGGGAGADTLVEPTSDGPNPPSTETRRTGRNDYEVRVSGAGEPYWVVLGQSFGAGWSATTTDGEDLGAPTLVNGYANGWRIDPSRLGADVTVQLRWTPQRLVWAGLGASALGVLLCLALALWPRRSRTDDGPALVTGQPMEPVLHRPDTVDGPALAPVRAAVVGLVAGVVGVVFVGWVAGLAVALLVGVSLVWSRGQLVLRAAALGLLAAAFGYVVLKQARNDYPLDFDWMEWFQITHQWTLAAMVLVFASVVVDSLRRSGED
jgi:arabinofuranan 3-O-arabinosyltransferase